MSNRTLRRVKRLLTAGVMAGVLSVGVASGLLAGHYGGGPATASAHTATDAALAAAIYPPGPGLPAMPPPGPIFSAPDSGN